MKVGDLLNAKGTDVVTITPVASVADAARLLSENRIGALVATADGRSIDGIVSERDIVRALAQLGGNALDLPVAEVMTAEVNTCQRGDNLADLARRMTEGRFRHLPVEEAGELRGMISIGDVVKRRLDTLEVEQEQLTSYIRTGR